MKNNFSVSLPSLPIKRTATDDTLKVGPVFANTYPNRDSSWKGATK